MAGGAARVLASTQRRGVVHKRMLTAAPALPVPSPATLRLLHCREAAWKLGLPRAGGRRGSAQRLFTAAVLCTATAVLPPAVP